MAIFILANGEIMEVAKKLKVDYFIEENDMVDFD